MYERKKYSVLADKILEFEIITNVWQNKIYVYNNALYDFLLKILIKIAQKFKNNKDFTRYREGIAIYISN